jgi:ferredoxin
MRERFSVDENLCIACGLCEARAPENLEVAPGAMSARVVKQPSDASELAACREASEYCPTGGLKDVTEEESAGSRAADEAGPGSAELRT